MCGIHGFTGRDDARMFRMLGAGAQRGPDGVGFYRGPNITLGQNLLSIMDVPDNSRQPWRLEGSGATLCFNGQIYNHAALASGLSASPITRSDTEVLARGMEEKGARFLEELEGMYALAFHTPHNGELLLARDPAGMKPLYYREAAGEVAFSSELRALLHGRSSLAIDQLAATLYFQLGYVPGPRTMLNGVCKLVPGEWRRYRVADGALLDRGVVGRTRPEPRAFKPADFRGAVRAAVEACALGLRPIGLYLSGGMDSAMLLHEAVALGVPVTTYSTRFVGANLDDFNEDADLARRLAEFYHVPHVEAPVTEAAFVEALGAVSDVVEEPLYNRSAPAYLLTARRLSEDGVVVTLAGDGGDEMLAGYPKYRAFEELRERSLFDPQSFEERSSLLDALRETGYWRWSCGPEFDLTDPVHRWYYMSKFRLEERGIGQGLRAPAPVEETLAYLQTSLAGVADGRDMLNDQLALDQLTWLPEDALIRNDKIGMSFGMEGRYPLVSRAFRNMAMAMPSGAKIVGGKLKRAARWAYEGVLPDFIVERRRKTGWAAPVLSWQADDGAVGQVVSGALKRRDAWSEFLDLDAIGAAREPKLTYSAINLMGWARRLGVEPPVTTTLQPATRKQ